MSQFEAAKQKIRNSENHVKELLFNLNLEREFNRKIHADEYVN